MATILFLVPRVLDLFCGAGGAGYGYYLAGYEVIGVDIEPQPHYPFKFCQADALTYPLDGFDLIHASPPCQAYSAASAPFKYAGKVYPDLVSPIRERLLARGIPYVIENVPGAPLLDPITLCGLMFALRVVRHRRFETSFPISAPSHPVHAWRTARMGRTPKSGQLWSVVGNVGNVPDASRAMGVSWTISGRELAQAIPPDYTAFIGRRAAASLSHITAAAS